MSFDPSSFRDPDARLIRRDADRVLRALTPTAAEFDRDLRAKGLLDALVEAGLLVESAPCADEPVPEGFAAVIAARRLPFVSYPYEWSFRMLQDAALVTLEVTERALQSDVVLKDASAYNVLFDGPRPVFVDLGSFAPLVEGTPWLAYAQFCDHFLAPLLLEACRGVPFQPFLRGNVEGLAIATQLAPLLSARDLLRAGVLTHVKLRAFLERRVQRIETGARSELRAAQLPKEAVLRSVRKMKRLISSLRSAYTGVWADYETSNTYEPAMVERKVRFVAEAAQRAGGGRLAWDLGANTGRYSEILAEHFAVVVAMDGDPAAIDRMYDRVKSRTSAILPLVVDLMNPSPAQGWRGRELAALSERGRPELATYLALVHHLCVARGLPLDAFVDFVRATSPHAVVEFVGIEDPQSQRILATKVVKHQGYDVDSFRTLATRAGRIVAEEQVSPTRTLFHLSFS